MFQDEDHYDKRDMPSISNISKRAKTEEGSAGSGSLPTPPDPTYAAMAMYYSKLNAFRPWSPKGGFPPLPGYPLQHPFGRSDLDVRRPDDLNQASLERFRSESESPHGKKKFDKGEALKIKKINYILTWSVPYELTE